MGITTQSSSISMVARTAVFPVSTLAAEMKIPSEREKKSRLSVARLTLQNSSPVTPPIMMGMAMRGCTARIP